MDSISKLLRIYCDNLDVLWLKTTKVASEVNISTSNI